MFSSGDAFQMGLLCRNTEHHHAVYRQAAAMPERPWRNIDGFALRLSGIERVLQGRLIVGSVVADGTVVSDFDMRERWIQCVRVGREHSAPLRSIRIGNV